MSSATVKIALPPCGGVPPGEVFWLSASDGVRLRAALWPVPDARGTVVYFSGRTEYLEKAMVPAAWCVERGLAFVTLDWRGQGLSDRPLEPRNKGHVDSFDAFQRDARALLEHPDVAALPGPRVLMCHSMGGAIGMQALREGLLAPKGVILSAPMMGLAVPDALRPVLWAVEKGAAMLGRDEAWLPGPGDPERSYVFEPFEDNVLTSDRAMWDWLRAAIETEPDLGLGRPTMGWMVAAREAMHAAREMPRLGLPGLVLLGSDEGVVDPQAVRMVAERQGFTLAEIAGARHECFMEAPPQQAATRAAIDGFLDELDL